MNKNTFIIFLVSALSATTYADVSTDAIRQEALPNATGSETLVAGIAAIVDKNLIIEVMGNERPSPWIHFFIDSDSNKETGFNHYLGGQAGLGLDIMIEGDIAYRFSGTDSSVWSWTPDPSIVVAKNYQDDILAIELPASSVELSDSPTFFSVVYTRDYAEAVDCLPRSGSTWTIASESKTVQNLKNRTKAKTSVSLATAITEKKTSAISRGPINRREAFNSISSYACYYGSGQLEAMSRRDAAIIETKNQTPESIAQLQAADTLVIGYISIGEDDAFRIGDGKGAGGYDSSYFDRNQDNVPDQNPIWKSHYADASQPAWRRYFLDRAYKMREEYGVDGFFLDTVDTSELYKESNAGMISLIRELRAQNPDSIIVLNRGFHTVEELAPDVDGVMFESFTASYDFENKEYIMLRPSAWDWGLDVYLQTLKPAMDAHGLVVLVLDYVSSPNAPEVKAAYDRAVSFGYVPEVSTIFLDTIYQVDYQGIADPKYLEVQATPEVMAYTLPEARNGFPQKTLISPSSVYSDYTVAPVVDGVTEKARLHWRNRAWASQEKAKAHTLEFRLPVPVAARQMKIDWAKDNGHDYPAKKFRVEVQTPQSSDWLELVRFETNEAASNQIDLRSIQLSSIRIIQEQGGGSPERPNLMWVQQVELIK
jgi:uncharacterized protein (TIGR01370 family)